MLAAALLLLVPPALYATGVILPRNLPFGYCVFFAWAALCVAAVLRRRMLVWAILCGLPLVGVSVDWIGPTLPQDDFGFFPWGSIALFCGIAIVTAASGTLSIVRAAAER